ncbi:hypothetical protein AB1L42_05955 [Thalassoglobus sp. JC818]|uniref:hypothetical protein n=1 Tax=Thalassoglobus sp. JC818 TaxID=3232136 RepID=UPI00345A28C7
MAFPSAVFFAGSYATACAALQPKHREARFAPYYYQRNKPTFAIFVLMISIITCQLTLAMNVFATFFKNGPGSFKYNVTLGIAILSTAFMQFYGKHVIRNHFGPTGGRRLELSGWQVFLRCHFCSLLFELLDVAHRLTTEISNVPPG